MMPGTQFLTPTVHCPGCGELIDFHPEEWFRRMVKYCATCGTLNESGWHQDQIGSELWRRVCGTEHLTAATLDAAAAVCHVRGLPHLVLLLDRAANEIRQQEGNES